MKLVPYRSTFDIKIQYDPDYGLSPWKWIIFYNGFSINFGILRFAIRIEYVARNYQR